MAGNRSLDVKVNFTMNGGDALNEFNQIKSKIKGTTNEASQDFKKVNVEADKAGNGIKTKLGGAFDTVKTKVRSFSDSFQGLNGIITGVMGAAGLSSFKSMTLDLTMARAKTKELMAATLGSKEAMNSFYGELKSGTKESVVALDMMLNAMNGIQISTGMGQANLSKLRPTIQKIGEASLLMGDDTEHATFVMREAASGLNGDFAVLKEQFGITADKMKAAGWSGAADDIDGYAKALEKCLAPMGDFSSISDTTTGKIEQIKKNFRTAGMDIGDQFVPYIDQAVSAFLDFQNSNDAVSQSILWIGGVTSALATIAPTLSPVFDTLDSIRDAMDTISDYREKIGDLSKKFGEWKEKIMGTEQEAGKLKQIQDKISGIKQSVLDKFDSLKDKISEAKDKISDLNIGEKITGIKESVLTSFTNFKNKIVEAKNALTDNISDKIKPIKESVLTSFTNFKNKIVEAKNALTENISDKIKPIKAAVISSYTNLKNKITDAKNALSSNISDKVQAIKGGVLSSWTSLKTKINDAKNAITQYDIKQKVVSAGSAIKGAVLSGWTRLTSSIRNAGNSLSTFTIKQKLATIAQKAHTIAITAWNAITKVATMVQAAFNAVLSMNPIGILVIAIVGLIAVLGYLYTNNEQVRNSINALGQFIQGTLVAAWNGLKAAIQPVINALQILWQVISPVVNDIGALFGALMTGGDLGGAFNKLLTDIPMVFNQLMVIVPMLVNMLVMNVVMRFNMLVASVGQVFWMVVSAIQQRLMQAWMLAGNLANMIRNAIVTRFNLIVARASAIFNSIVSAIKSRLSNAASQARAKAVQIYNNIVNKIRELPGKVGTEIASLADTIKNKLVEAGKRAFEGAKHLVAQFLAGMGIASPGTIQRKTAAEFSTLPGIITDSGVQSMKAVSSMAKNIVSTWEDGMGDGLTVPDVNTNNLDSLKSLSNGRLKVNFSDIQKQVIPITTPTVPNTNMMNNQRLNSQQFSQNRNSVVNNDDHTIVYNIEKINLECGELTQAQSRKVLYNALDGLYTGGL